MRELSPDRWTLHCWALVLLWIASAVNLNWSLGRSTTMTDAQLSRQASEFSSFTISGGWPFHYRVINCNPNKVSDELIVRGAVASTASILCAILSLLILLQYHFRQLSLRSLMRLTAVFAALVALHEPLSRGEILQGIPGAYLWFRRGLYFSPVAILAVVAVVKTIKSRENAV